MDYYAYRFLVAFTDLGDSAVLCALVITLSSYLYSQGCRREASVILYSFLFAALCMAISKVLLMGCGSSLRQYGLRSPSGHTALSFTVYGTIGLMLKNHMQGFVRYLPFLALITISLIIGVSRSALHFHTPQEVQAGMYIGIFTLFLSYYSLKKYTLHHFNPYALLFMFIAVAFVLHGLRLPAEDVIKIIAQYFKMRAHCA